MKTVNNNHKALAQNPAKNKGQKRLTWTTKKIQDLLKYIQENKSNCNFKDIDFEVDLAFMYTEIRNCMAPNYSLDFGPQRATTPRPWTRNIIANTLNKKRRKQF